MARPKKDDHERKDAQLNIRMTFAQFAAVESAASSLGVTAAEFGRHIFAKRRLPAPRAARVDPALVAQVRRVGVNLHQLLTDARFHGSVDRKAIRGVLTKIDLLMDAALADAGLSDGPAPQ